MSQALKTIQQIQTQKESIENEISTKQQALSTLEREEKAHSLIDNVTIIGDEIAEVISETDSKTIYTVDYKLRTCTCKDHIFRHVLCKHYLAVVLFLERKETEPTVEPSKPTPIDRLLDAAESERQSQQ